MGEFFFNSEEVRFILQNAGKIKRDGACIQCGGTGWENWNGETGDDVKHGQSDNPDRDSAECETCNGVGYIW